MPTNLVKSKQDEADWAEARRIVDKQYPDKSPDDKDKSYWKLTTSIYENIKKNRGKKQMQKQASVGELLAGQIRLRKQADGPVSRLDKITAGGKRTRLDKITAGGHVDTWDNRDWGLGASGLTGYRPGDSRVVTADKINAGGHVDTLEYRGPGFVKRGGRWVQDPEWAPLPSPRQPLPAPNWPTQGKQVPLPVPTWPPQGKRVPLPAPNRFPMPIPRHWWERPEYPEYPENPPNDPLENERIRRLVEGNKAPESGGEWGERPINDNEIPLPDDDPGGAPAPAPNNRPSNTPTPSKGLDPKILEEWFRRRSKGGWRGYDEGWGGRPSNEGEQPSEEWEWPYDRWGRPIGEWGRIYDKWFWPKGQYYHRGRGRNGEIDPRGINIQPDAWYQGRTLPPMSVRDMQY